MTVRLGDIVPDFTAESTQGTIRFHEWIGNGWAIFFSHPKDFTPVCTTELGAVAKLKDKFAQKGVKVVALSVDSVDDHKKWIKDINETQHCVVDYPIIGDPERKVANLYDMIHPNAIDNLTIRSVFVIGPDKKLKLTLTYPASTGRNFDEIFRVVESLQLTAKYSVATPADWKPGQDCIISPSVKDEEIAGKFPKGHKVIKPYLRTTPQPNL
jgi:alkyl hydroperoxide reductase subunit AhpC